MDGFPIDSEIELSDGEIRVGLMEVGGENEGSKVDLTKLQKALKSN